MTPFEIANLREQIEGFCHRWQITELALFGSVLTDEFRPDSDIDVLVTFSKEANMQLQNRDAAYLWELIRHRQPLIPTFPTTTDEDSS